ncbi:uncharacterized protein LOC124265792 [Haliotis rubra]|uniref:uncharacterized protein LOC124265792 n=1 Tax=Haliotis rubra TaxID=36100 RepID=UPI001EE58EA1|nr:uncharacterized protein LOC124265792 [Haliotis rubra]
MEVDEVGPQEPSGGMACGWTGAPGTHVEWLGVWKGLAPGTHGGMGMEGRDWTGSGTHGWKDGCGPDSPGTHGGNKDDRPQETHGGMEGGGLDPRNHGGHWNPWTDVTGPRNPWRQWNERTGPGNPVEEWAEGTGAPGTHMEVWMWGLAPGTQEAWADGRDRPQETHGGKDRHPGTHGKGWTGRRDWTPGTGWRYWAGWWMEPT